MPKNKKLPTPANPFIRHVKRRKATVIDQQEKDEKRDVWSRKAKHKGNEMTKKLDERVMGMSNIDSLRRIQELAGVKPLRNIKELDELGDDFDEVPVYDDGEDLNTVDGLDGADMGEIPTDDIGPEIGDDMGGMDISGEVDADFDTGIGGDDFSDLPPVAPTGAVMDSSPAFNDIAAKISEIESQITNIKVSEYKEVTALLRNLYQSVRDSGFNFLQENRNLKK